MLSEDEEKSALIGECPIIQAFLLSIPEITAKLR
jgi:hypothetical protein